jgi:2-hydroxychromene-2-carboxylate isomerase
VQKGVFGAPAFVVEGELYWGQDRLTLVEEALGGAIEPCGEADAAVKELDFYFDFSSPFAYLAATQVEALARRNRAIVRHRPFLLGALFKAIGTADVPLLEMPEPKRVHTVKDMQRWAARYGVPLRFPSRFPMNTVKALRMVLQVPEASMPALVGAIFRAYWADDRDIGSDAELAAIATSVGLDGAALVAGTKDDAIKERLRAATQEAQDVGACGAPTFRVNGLLFWGQDRLSLVEKALRGWRPRGE